MAIIEGNCVNFPEFGDNLLAQLHQLHAFNMFLDMSILCFGSEIFAHKIILAAASPLLRDRLQEFGDCYARLELEQEFQKCHATADDMRSLIEFIYRGQVCVPQPRLSIFLELGNHLQILGLNRQPHGGHFPLLSQQMPSLVQSFPLGNQDTINYEELSSLHVGNDAVNNFFPNTISLMSPVKMTGGSIKQDKTLSNHSINPMFNNTNDGQNISFDVPSIHTISDNHKLIDISSDTTDFSNFASNHPSAIDVLSHSNDYTHPEHRKDIFDDNSTASSPGASDPDILFNSLSNQPNSFFTTHLDPSVASADPCSLDLTFQPCKVVPDFPARQVRLKVKDSIGGVSLQDTSRGEKTSEQVQENLNATPICKQLQIVTKTPKSSSLDLSNTSEVGEKLPKCLQCSLQFSSTDQVTLHMWEQHNIGTQYKCLLCPFFSLIENKLIEHGRSHLSSSDRQCCICGRKFKTRTTLRNHLSCHASNKWFKCDECNAHYSQRLNLTKHLASKHRLNSDGSALDQDLQCSMCTFKTFAPHKLESHKIRCHTKDKAFKCTQCSYSATDKTSLAKHSRTHTNERPYTCNECEYSSVTVSALKRHSRSHTKEKPHVCTECGQQYADRKRLRDHLLKHQNLKPFKCPQCNYCCRRKDNLQSHITRSHKEVNE